MSSSLACRRVWLILVLAGPAAIILCAGHASGQFRPTVPPPRPTIPTIPKVTMPPRPDFPRPNPVVIPPIQTPRPNPVVMPPMPMPRPNINPPGGIGGGMGAGMDFWECGRCKGNMGSANFPMPATCPRCGAKISNSPLNAGGGNNPPGNPGFNGNTPRPVMPVAQAPAGGRSGNMGIVIGVMVGIMIVVALIGGVAFVVIKSLATATPKKKKKRYHGDY